MGLTIQQFFDYVDNMTEDKPGVVLKGKRDSNDICYRIHLAHDKFFLDTIKNEKNIGDRYVLDKEELQIFKVKVMELLKKIDVENIYIE
ncbi:hypothetical protein [Paramaledivibacter caminithermalis]|uniref:Uncharacterized protein n=1 Tax=Paramaledivibacter caminithermalis (strain DSM 15212 / CIP 107654 / DViRD3) TaxID=1121301 RepID=A0A1M6R843_PARC5|nr:hypothetical protein [Paramaledivibacter caminithermalis]SHK28641.1 hypothetical protein SAMN02745912_02870 [Paramaledivibacter caminithermalis DSM 15212]